MSSIKKSGLVAILAIFIILPFGQVMALGPTTPVGPKTLVGPRQPTGPRGPVGPRVPTGPRPSPTIPPGPASQAPTPSPTSAPVEPTVTASASPTLEGQAIAPGSNQVLAIDQENQQTGPSSENINQTDLDQNLKIKENNVADLDNQVELELNTGRNEVEKNSVVDGVETGSIDGSVNLINLGNTQFSPESSLGLTVVDGQDLKELELNPARTRVKLPQSNESTGPTSVNKNIYNSNTAVEVVNHNQAKAENTIKIIANTGDNTLFENTQLGDFLTGDINLNVNLINLLNVMMPETELTLDFWTILNDFSGDIIIPKQVNESTGPFSINENTLTNDQVVQVTVEQKSSIDNLFKIEAETGSNKISNNSLVGDIILGSTNVEGRVINLANLGVVPIYLVNVFGHWVGEALDLLPEQVVVSEMKNSQTGPDSENKNIVNDTDSTKAKINNEAEVDNQLTIEANTGKNQVERNTKVKSIQTGNINIMANVVNLLNTIGEGVKKLSLSVVNIFGNWRGNARRAAVESPTQTIEPMLTIPPLAAVPAMIDSPANTPTPMPTTEPGQRQLIAPPALGQLPVGGSTGDPASPQNPATQSPSETAIGQDETQNTDHQSSTNESQPSTSQPGTQSLVQAKTDNHPSTPPPRQSGQLALSSITRFALANQKKPTGDGQGQVLSLSESVNTPGRVLNWPLIVVPGLVFAAWLIVELLSLRPKKT